MAGAAQGGCASGCQVGLLFNPELQFGTTYLPSIEAAASQLAVRVVRIPYRSPAELGNGADSIAAEPNGGVIILPPVGAYPPFFFGFSRIGFPLSPVQGPASPLAFSCFMELTTPTCFDVLRPMWIGFCTVRSQAICLFSSRSNSRWYSTSRPRRRWASRFHERFAFLPPR